MTSKVLQEKFSSEEQIFLSLARARIWSYPVDFLGRNPGRTGFLLSVSTRQKFNCGNVSLKMETERKVSEIPLYYLLGKFPRIFFQGQKSFGFLSLSSFSDLLRTFSAWMFAHGARKKRFQALL